MDTPQKTNRFRGFEFAIFLILIGALFLLFNTGIIPIIYKPIVISWQMLLVVIGIWLLIKRWFTGGIITLLVGGFFLYQKLGAIFPEHFTAVVDFKTYWPVFLIALGIILVLYRIFRPHRRWHHDYRYCKNNQAELESQREEYEAENNTTNYIDKSLMFGATRQIILSSDFKGGKIDLMFGEFILDLRKSKLAEGVNYLEANVMFGNIVVHVPSDWVVELRSETLLGNFQDSRNDVKMPEETNSTKLIIIGKSVFGNGEIQY